MTLSEKIGKVEEALELVANNATPHNSCVLVCREALQLLSEIKLEIER